MNDSDTRVLSGTYTYRRVGYDERTMELLPDGTIGEGQAACERRWAAREIEGRIVLEVSGAFGVICRLIGINGKFRGNWLQFEKMPIELVAVETRPVGTPRDTFQPTDCSESSPVTEFAVGIPTLNRFDLLSGCIQSVLKGSIVPDAIYVIDNSCGKWQGHSSSLVKSIVPQYNLGCARSWNLLMQLLRPVPTIILSDDIEVGRNTCERMLTCCAELVAASAGAAMMAFLIRPEVWKRIGKFDEAFYPIYHEDNDYVRRAYLADVKMGCPVSDGFHDHGPSATKQSLNSLEVYEWNHSFNLCREYYLRKWGGVPHHETFTVPFNCDEQQRHASEQMMEHESSDAIVRWRKIELGVPLTDET